jgi:hypothetical protein
MSSAAWTTSKRAPRKISALPQVCSPVESFRKSSMKKAGKSAKRIAKKHARNSERIELTAVPQFQVRLRDLLHSHPGRSRSQRRPRAVRPSDPSIHPQDRKPASVPRGQPSRAKASPELGMVFPDPWCPRIQKLARTPSPPQPFGRNLATLLLIAPITPAGGVFAFQQGSKAHRNVNVGYCCQVAD